MLYIRMYSKRRVPGGSKTESRGTKISFSSVIIVKRMRFRGVPTPGALGRLLLDSVRPCEGRDDC